MNRLKAIVLGGEGVPRAGGSYERVTGIRETCPDDLAGGFRMTRPLRVVCATSSGTAGAFAPELLAHIGAEVVYRHTTLDYTFPHYNPNPEALEMLEDMAAEVRRTRADLALGFDGDGDRCGVVDGDGNEIFADKMGVIRARPCACPSKRRHRCRREIDRLFAADPALQAHGIRVDYWKTGHSHMKRRDRELGAIVGFEKSGHYVFAPPLGRGYDDGLRVAVELCRLLDRNPGPSLADLARDLPSSWSSPTMWPFCPDDRKYAVLDRIVAALSDHAAAGRLIAGRPIAEIITVNGARVILDNTSRGLVRASSNTPHLVVCESFISEAEMHAIFADLDAIIRREPEVGAYDQRI